MFHRRTIARLCTVLIAIALTLAVVPRGVRGQDATPTVPWTASGELDLAAMPVLPSDLEALGLPGLGRFFNGAYLSPDEFATGTAGFYGQPVDDTRAVFDRMGVRRVYVSGMGLPSEPGNPDSPPDRGAYANVIEIENPTEGDAFYDLVNASPGPETEAQFSSVEAPFALGERALVGNFADLDPETGERYFEYFLILQVDTLLVDVGFWTSIPADPATPGATPEATPEAAPVVDALTSPAATIDELEELGRRQVERIEDVKANGAPNLSDLILRLGDDPLLASWDYTEGYRLLDGEIPPYYNGFEDDILADPNASIGAEAILELEERFVVGEDPEDGDDPYFVSRIFTFPDEAAATAFMDGREEASGGIDLITGVNPEETEAVLLPGEVTDLGDQSLAFSYVIADDLGSAEGYQIFVRVGDVVAAVILESPIEPTIDLLADIAAAQADCLAAGACPDAYPVPDGFLAEPAPPAQDATPEASPVA